MQKLSLISSMNLQQPYTSIVVNAVGVASKFNNYVRVSDHETLVEKYNEYITCENDLKNLRETRKTEEKEYKKKNEPFPKSKIDEYNKREKELKKLEKSLELSKGDMIKAKNLLSERGQKETKGPTLDLWQRQAIDNIMGGKSVAIFGPTSGGKTYLVKYVINEIKGAGIKTIFVAPTFHLALQTYADIQATYSGFPASIITDKLIEWNKDSWIYVGTAEQLLNFIVGRKIPIQVGIFDEIHSISTNTFTDYQRIKATRSLLGLCEKQVVALSATVKSEDKSRLIVYIDSVIPTTCSKLSEVSYVNRVVPQEFFVYNNTQIVPGNSKVTTVDTSPENMLKLMLQMREKDMLPSLYFTMQNCYQNFSKFLNYLEDEEAREYKRFHRMAEDMNPSINEFNELVNEFNEIISRCSQPSDSKEVKAKERIIIERRLLLVNIIREKILDVISKIIINLDDIQNYDHEDPIDPPKYLVPSPGWYSDLYFKIPLKNEGEKVDLKSITPTPELIDLCKLYGLYNNTAFEDSATYLPTLPIHKGRFFVFGNPMEHIFSTFNAANQSKDNKKIRQLVIEMAGAEGIDEKKVTKFVTMIGKGFEFGVTALVKELPFFIQYQIMEMMKNKNLGAVFANDSMSMGINYPLRSVVIMSEENQPYFVNKLLQMAGRCGRRGFDTKSYVITWGIQNTRDMITGNVEEMVFTDEDYSIDKYDPSVESYEEKIMKLTDKELLQNIFMRYQDKIPLEMRTKILEKYRKMCEEEYGKY